MSYGKKKKHKEENIRDVRHAQQTLVPVVRRESERKGVTTNRLLLERSLVRGKQRYRQTTSPAREINKIIKSRISQTYY